MTDPTDADPAVLDDGVYDVFVVGAEPDDGAVALSLTVTSGPLKSEVVELRRSGTPLDAVRWLGLPGELTVDGGVPRVRLG